MATTTIHSLKYQIVADTSKFTKAIIATKDELKLQKKLIQETRGPAMQYGAALDRIRSMQERGLLTMAEYRRAVNRIKTEMRGGASSSKMFEAAAGRLKGTLIGVGTAITASFGIAAITRSITHATNEFDRFNKTARRTGIDIESLQLLTHGLGLQVDASPEEVERMLVTMIKNIGLAETGNQKMVKVLDTLRLSSKELGKMKAADQFMAVADAIAQMPDKSQQMAMAMKLMGDSGAIMIESLRGGSQELEKSLDYVRELDVVIGQLDADKLSDANDAIKEMSLQWTLFAGELATAIAPVIRELTFLMKDLRRWELPGIADLESQMIKRNNTRFNVRTLHRYQALREEITGSAHIPEVERKRMFGDAMIADADPVHARKQSEAMLAELRAIRENTQGNGPVRSER